MIADLDTRCGELYASGDELLPAGQAGSDCAAAFARSREQFDSLVGFLDGANAACLSHAELEERLEVDGRELLRRLLDDHLALRALRERRLERVVGTRRSCAAGSSPGTSARWRRCSGR